MSLEQNGKSEIKKRPWRWPFLLLGLVTGCTAPIIVKEQPPQPHRITVFEFIDRPAREVSLARSISGKDVPLRFTGERLIEWQVHTTRRVAVAIHAVYADSDGAPVEATALVRLDPKELECRVRIRATAELIEISQCLRRNPNVS